MPKQRRKRVNLAERLQLSPPPPDPFENVEYSGSLEKDTALELNALQTAFRQRRTREDQRKTAATDSEFWFAVCFDSRQAKDEFLARFGLDDLGDKYLDGGRVAERLKE